MIGGGAVARLAVGRTDVVSILGDLQSGPVISRQGGDQTGDYAGLADAAGVAADDENGHRDGSTVLKESVAVLASGAGLGRYQK